MKVHHRQVGPLLNNVFVLTDDAQTAGVFIDPAWGSDTVLEWAQGFGVPLERIIDTHGHFDHSFENALYKQHTGGELLIHKDDEEFIQKQVEHGRLWGAHVPASPAPDGYLADGQSLKIGSEKISVFHCPGHSPGSVCLYLEDAEIGDAGFPKDFIPGGKGRGPLVITGDVLFAGSIGRTDLPGGNMETLIGSIKNRLLTLPDETRVFPGHNDFSVVEEERDNNPFLSGNFF